MGLHQSRFFIKLQTRPRVDRRGSLNEREGLAPGVWEKILKVIDSSSPDKSMA